MTIHEPPGGEFEELKILFPKLCRFSISCSKRLGCIYPEECGTDTVTEYLFDRRLRGEGRGVFVGELIFLNYPAARDQRKVLYALLKQEVRGKRSRCKDCKRKNLFCRVSDDSRADEDDRPRFKQQTLIDPKTPYDILLAKEIVEKTARAVGDAGRLKELFGRGAGESYKELAKRSGSSDQTVRQRVARLRNKIAGLLGIQISRGKKKPPPSGRKHPPRRTRRVARGGGRPLSPPADNSKAE